MKQLIQRVVTWFVLHQEFDFSEHPKPMNFKLFRIKRIGIAIHWDSGILHKTWRGFYVHRSKKDRFGIWWRIGWFAGPRSASGLQRVKNIAIRVHWMEQKAYEEYLKHEERLSHRGKATFCANCGRYHPGK